jgi:hypothetical protein
VVTGPRAKLRKRWHEVEQIVKFKEKPAKLDKFLGIIHKIVMVDDQKRILEINQVDYCNMLLLKYMESLNVKKLYPTVTPMLTDSSDKVARIDDLPEVVEQLPAGQFASTCRAHIGSLLWLARGSRPDISYAVGKLAKSCHKWTTESDSQLHRIYQYLSGTADKCLRLPIDVRDRGHLRLALYCDADFAGDLNSRKSTSGWIVELVGDRTRVTLDWGSKLQTFVAKSSAESEIVALSTGLARIGLSLQTLLTKLRGNSVGSKREAELTVYCDSATGIAAIKAGSSRAMRYVEKTQGVHLAWLRQVFETSAVNLRFIAGAVNPADVFTKALGSEKLRQLLGRITG